MCTFFLYVIVALSIILESFPLSSSGHILLLQTLFKCNGIGFFLNENIEYFLHGSTALILAIFFYNRWKLFLIIPRSLPLIQKMFMRGFITDGITVGAYFIFFKDNNLLPLWVGFLITGFLILSLFFCKKSRSNGVWSYSNAFILGVVQACALMPGISRFGSTFVAARWLGFSNKKAFELSFLIEWPINVAAALKGGYALYQHNQLFELLHLKMLLVMLIASSFALLGLCIMRQIIMNNSLWLFSIYLFLLAIFTAVI